MKHLLIVDDDVTNLKQAQATLENEFQVTLLTAGKQALKFLGKQMPDLILLDIEMPAMTGFEVVAQLKIDLPNLTVPIIFLTGLTQTDIEVKALSIGVVDFIHKPFVPEIMLSRIRLQLELSDYRRNLEGLVREKTAQIEKLQDAISISIAELVGCRDGYTGVHVKRVCDYLRILLRTMLQQGVYADELNETFVVGMMQAAALHDIGKVGINDAILGKPDKFTADEFELMKQHSRLGGETLQHAIDHTACESFLYLARDMAFAHHEKWNGTGYLRQLAGDKIPLCARIVAIVDVYDALTSERPYKKPFPHSEAVEIIKKESGQSFEPILVDTFLKCADEFANRLANFNQTSEKKIGVRSE